MSFEPPPPRRPVMIFDGDCAFCRRWIGRWRSLTGEAVEFAPWQEAAERYPQIPPERFREAVQLVEPDGAVYSGAEAVFRALRLAPGKAWLSGAYVHVPGFALVTEAGYRFVARRRRLFSFFTRLLWGAHLERPTYRLSTSLFLRLVGLVYLIAFASLWVQVEGLIGSGGVLPAQRWLHLVADNLGPARFRHAPTLLWLNAGDRALHAVCGAGAALGMLALAGLAWGPILLALWALYLSMVVVGQDFLSFQWDTLLLETGLLAAIVSPWRMGRRIPPAFPNGALVWLVRWLLFRLMFLSGVTKLVYGDQTWHDWTALAYHYETQPLPTMLGWYAHHLPAWFGRASVGVMFVVELAVPFLIFGPRRLKQLALAALVVFQLLIAATGNYCFFNVLTIILCLPLLDDAALGRLSRRPALTAKTAPARRPLWRRGAVALVVGLIAALSSLEAYEEIGGRGKMPAALDGALGVARPLRSINGYGLFRVMTTQRPEIIVEGSDDQRVWKEYAFRYKPGDVMRRPRWNAPHQPRLDWQMWFAALSAPRRPVWFLLFVQRLLEGSPAVVALLEKNPFPERPPKYVRATLYNYHFTTPEQRAATGMWWRRELVGTYLPPVSLDGR